MVKLLKQFYEEKWKWDEAGQPYRTKERIREIYDICSKCPLFLKKEGFVHGYDKCSKCGCNLHPKHKTLNKIAWATTECPKDDPEWGPDVPSG